MNADKIANYTKVKAQELQDKLYLAAKENLKRRFHALYDKIHREDILVPFKHLSHISSLVVNIHRY